MYNECSQQAMLIHSPVTYNLGSTSVCEEATGVLQHNIGIPSNLQNPLELLALNGAGQFCAHTCHVDPRG